MFLRWQFKCSRLFWDDDLQVPAKICLWFIHSISKRDRMITADLIRRREIFKRHNQGLVSDCCDVVKYLFMMTILEIHVSWAGAFSERFLKITLYWLTSNFVYTSDSLPVRVLFLDKLATRLRFILFEIQWHSGFGKLRVVFDMCFPRTLWLFQLRLLNISNPVIVARFIVDLFYSMFRET